MTARKPHPRLGALLACGLALLAVTAPAAAAPRIEWRVENPFRLFNDAADTEVHRQTLLSLSARDRRTPVLSSERALAERHPDGWAATMFRKTCWHWADNRHACADQPNYLNPRAHTVVVAVQDLDPADQGAMCTWLTAPLGRNATRGSAIESPCREPLLIDIPYPSGAFVTAEVDGRRIATTRVVVQDLLIAGLGDSFGSGEGNPDLPVRFSRERSADYANPQKVLDLVGYPARVGSWRQIGDKDFIEENARWLDQACHRSLYSHQLRAALQLSLEDPHRAVTYVGLACSGAEVTTGLFLRYKGNEWVPNPPALSQVSALADAQCAPRGATDIDMPEAFHMNEAIPELKGGLVLKRCEPERARRIDLLLLSIGGNDVGFSRLVANAVLSDESNLRRLGGWIGQVHGKPEAERQLKRLDDRYKSLNRALHTILHIPWGESDRIVLTAYPGLALLDDGRSACPDGKAGMDVLGDFAMSRTKASDGNAVGEQLHRLMRTAARTHSWTFVEAHRDAFLGRGICAGFTESAFSIADDLRLPRKLNGDWVPYNPGDYQAYAPRQRWFRTPNDAFMTGNVHVAGSVMQRALKLESLSWFQVLIAATYSGAFHPTAEGHAAIADAVVERARAVIEKYAGRNREK
jgi:hypothetical protein